MRTRIIAIAVAAALLAFAFVAPGLRRRFIQDIITWDAPPSEPAHLPAGTGEGLSPAPRVRVVLIDGLSARAASHLKTWSALCERGLKLRVDVGFPTVSLPIQVSLWTGLTQQQTGVLFRSDRPLNPPLDRRGIPARVLGSHAVAESHGFIVRSLGFSITEPMAAEQPHRDANPDAWKAQWKQAAVAAVASPARLAFVHILRVDTWGHRRGHDSMEYALAAGEADAMLAQLVATAPDARWFLLADHGHLAGGGHGGEDHEVRHVQHCIVGPDIKPATSGLVHLADVSRALADSLGLPLDKRALGRPMAAALEAPLAEDQAIPPIGLGIGAVVVLCLVLGAAATAWAVRRHWWLAPWWFVLACLLLLAIRGFPTMSMPMVYAKEDISDFLDFDRRLMMRTWFATLPIAAAATWFGLGRTTLLRVLVGQLALPFAAFAAVLTACGGWAPLFGAHVSPMVPMFTAFTLVLFLIVAFGSAAVALSVLARSVQQVFDRRRSAGTARSAPSAD